MSATCQANFSQVLPEPTDQTQRQLIIFGTITFTGNYGVANGHGDILDFAGLGDFLKSNQLPTSVFIYEEAVAGNAPTGYEYLYARGVDQHTGKVQVLQGGGAAAPNQEITQGAAYPAAILAAVPGGPVVIKFEATFPNQI